MAFEVAHRPAQIEQMLYQSMSTTKFADNPVPNAVSWLRVSDLPQ